MKCYRKELWFEVPRRMAFVSITRDVEACLQESGIREGLCLVKTKQPGFLHGPFRSNWPVLLDLIPR